MVKIEYQGHKIVIPFGEPSNVDTGTSGTCHKVILPEASPEKRTL